MGEVSKKSQEMDKVRVKLSLAVRRYLELYPQSVVRIEEAGWIRVMHAKGSDSASIKGLPHCSACGTPLMKSWDYPGESVALPPAKEVKRK